MDDIRISIWARGGDVDDAVACVVADHVQNSHREQRIREAAEAMADRVRDALIGGTVSRIDDRPAGIALIGLDRRPGAHNPNRDSAPEFGGSPCGRRSTSPQAQAIVRKPDANEGSDTGRALAAQAGGIFAALHARIAQRLPIYGGVTAPEAEAVADAFVVKLLDRLRCSDGAADRSAPEPHA